MQIFLNGHELDLYSSEKIALTMQINDLADISKANTSYTNKFKVPKTAKNIRIMNYLGVPGNGSRIPYSLNDVTVIEDSLVLLHQGYCEVSDTDANAYNLNIYGSEKTFFEKLKLYTLKDVYPVTNILWKAQQLLSYLNQNINFCFPVAQYNADTIHSGSLQTLNAVFSKTKATASSPHFYLKYLFERIFSFLGYTVSYPMVNDQIFAKLVIPSQKGVSHFGVVHGDTFNIQNCVPEVSCDILIKEVMFRYGLIIKVNEFDKKVTFTKLDALLKNGPVLDWSDKFSGFRSEKYILDGYGQKNYFRYKDDVPDENFPTVSPENLLLGSFSIDNQTLNADKTVIDSAFQKPRMFRYYETNDYARGRIFFHTTNTDYFLYDVAENTVEQDGDYNLKEVPFQLYYLRTIGTVSFTFFEDNGTARTTLLSNARACTLDNLSFQGYLDSNYPQIISLLNNVNVMKCNMKLSVLDIHQFDFFSRIYLKQFGSYFYVNKISNFQKNKLVEVELVKIPPVVGGGGYYYGQTNNMIGTL